MNTDSPDAFPAPASLGTTPPTVRGEMPARRPAWPTVIGVIGMVLSILGILGGIWGLFAPLIFSSTFDNPNFRGPPIALNVIMQLVSIAVSTLLLYGAVSVLGWNRRAPRLLRTYAIVQLITGTIGAGYAVILSAETMAGMQSQMGGASSQLVMIMAVLGGCMGFLFMAAFPVFLLVWFTREGVKRDVARWFTGGDAPTA